MDWICGRQFLTRHTASVRRDARTYSWDLDLDYFFTWIASEPALERIMGDWARMVEISRFTVSWPARMLYHCCCMKWTHSREPVLACLGQISFDISMVLLASWLTHLGLSFERHCAVIASPCSAVYLSHLVYRLLKYVLIMWMLLLYYHSCHFEYTKLHDVSRRYNSTTL